MTNNANIIYKDIPGYDGLYRVSNFGDVISCSRDVFTGSGDKRRIIKLKEKRLNPSNRKSFKNFVKEINYTPRKKIELSSDALEKIRDKNIPRQEVAKIFNLSINQIKRIRKGNNTIYTC